MDKPDLSVVIVSTDHFNTIRKTIRHLRDQTIQDSLEVIIIAHSARVLDLDTSAGEGFYGFRVIEVGAIPSVDRALATGVRQAVAPVIALLEDHAFPAPNWAETLVKAHQGPWIVAGSGIANANPQSMLSWANLLLGYGPWVEPVKEGEVDDLPRHNISYKRKVLMKYDAVLEEMLERDSGFHQILKAGGCRFYMAPTTIYHINPSLLTSVIALRFQAGRLYGGKRAQEGRWSPLKRLFNISASPLIPLFRLRKLLSNHFRAGPYRKLLPLILPAIMVGLISDAIGQAVGYAIGTGNALQKLADFEVDRLRHVTNQDRHSVMN